MKVAEAEEFEAMPEKGRVEESEKVRAVLLPAELFETDVLCPFGWSGDFVEFDSVEGSSIESNG